MYYIFGQYPKKIIDLILLIGSILEKIQKYINYSIGQTPMNFIKLFLKLPCTTISLNALAIVMSLTSLTFQHLEV